MAAIAAAGPVADALIAKLRTVPLLLTRLGGASGLRIWDEPPSGTVRSSEYPYLLVESGEEEPFGRVLGPPSALKFGNETHPVARIVSQYRGDGEVNELFSAVVGALHEQPLVVAGFASVTVEFQSSALMKETVSGVTTRERVITFDVAVHQT